MSTPSLSSITTIDLTYKAPAEILPSEESKIFVPINYNRIASYEDIKDKIRPFDVLAFRGGDLISNFISTLESYEVGIGAFSHVGMAVTADILPFCVVNGKEFHLKPGRVYVFESTFTYEIPGIMDSVPDVTTDHGKLGVQLRDLEEVIPVYITDKTTKIAWCKLKNNPLDHLPEESDEQFKIRQAVITERFKGLFAEYDGRMYEIDLVSLFGAMFPAIRPLRTIRDDIYNTLYSVLNFVGLANVQSGPAGWQFCSELVSNIYQAYDVIPKTVNTKNVLPVDFFGYDRDGLPALVEEPVFIKDMDLPGKPAIHYKNDISTMGTPTQSAAGTTDVIINLRHRSVSSCFLQ
ncbi:Hypothetical protein HVR_LOCUS211 [uncultured virus]|nr:Hypothetical protein HVR_LOCUS211 [uncultured virus]